MENRIVKNVNYVVLFFLVVLLYSCAENPQKAGATPPSSASGFNGIFFDIKDVSIRVTNSDSVARLEKRFENLNLSGKDFFWPGHDQFFLHAMGAINFPDSAKYTLRLAATGKIVFRLNNIDIFNYQTMKDTIAEKSVHNNPGENLFEFEYFDGGTEPKIVLEWSKNGGPFEVVPGEAISVVNRQKNVGKDNAETKESPSDLNTLTEKEKKDGWQLLFDGKSTKGWHRFNSPGTIGSRWVAENGNLTFKGRHRFRYNLEGFVIEMGPTDKRGDGGLDIVTDKTFSDFELNLEWNISEGGNSGIFYTVMEDPKYDEAWKTSPEMQVIDNYAHKDGIINKHRAGDLYDLIASKKNMALPAGEWNKVRIIKNKGSVQHWLNGVLIVEYSLNSPEWKQLKMKSKFAILQDYATATQCRIGLQDHDNEVWFRNLKIKELK